MRLFFCGLAVVALSLLPRVALAQERLLQQYLESGQIQAGKAAVTAALVAQPSNDSLRLQLGLAKFFGAVESYSQGMYRLGLQDSFRGQIPFLRFPVEPNPDPQIASNSGVREVLQRFVSELGDCGTTLAEIPDSSPVRLPLRFGRVRLDLNGDGQIQQREELWRVLAQLNRGLPLDEKTGPKLGMHLDAADVRWLEGYCHLLAALGETTLAYDTGKIFDHCGHLFFARVKSPYAFLKAPTQQHWNWEHILDTVTLIHLLNFPVQEGARLEVARQHLLTVVALSRRSWDCVALESDDHYEWLPGPRQRGVVPQARVSAEMLVAWRQFLDEAEAILQGKLLLPFWREQERPQGLNLRRVLQQPQPLDLILWLQGPGAAPYLEEGPITTPEFWSRLNRAFRGNFLGFALWFN